MASTPPAPRRTFPEALRSRSDEHLVALLLQRPDLATPSPSTLRSLAARATSRTSLDRAIARLDALELQVLESVLVLGDQHAPRTPTSRPAPSRPATRPAGEDTAVTVDRVLAALGASDGDAPVVRAAVAHLEEAALLWDRDPSPRTDLAVAPGLSEVLGPYPAGLGPTDPSSPLAAPPTGDPAFGPPGTTPLGDLLADAPPGARNILDALTWGPPVGVAPRADPAGREATTWLLRRRLLLASDERHVVLPREVGLALRGGRTHARPLAHPPEPEAPHFAEDTIAAEAARAAQDAVRLVAHLLALWQASPPSVLRAGGLGVRDLRRLATTLEVEEPTAAFVAELALAAGLVVDDGEDPPTFTVTVAGEDWLDLPLAPRWALLAAAWAGSGRTPWTVGSRDERGTLRAALEPDLSRPWVPRLRFDLLSALADRPGTALTSADLLAVLRWGSPRSVPPVQAIEGLLHEAHLLGVTGVGALAPTGRALLLPDGATPAARPGAPAAPSRSGAPALTSAETTLATALESVLPPEVDELLLQGDLTGIVPGRPSTALERLLEDAAEVESRGAAITVRFTPESLTRAFDAGRTADDLLADLAGHSRTTLPQPLDYLVRDTARRHGRLRVGSASSYVRAEDAALLTGLVEDPSLRHLSLFRIAPTVLVSLVPAATLQAALRDRGLASTVEGPDGRVVRTERLRTTARSRVGGRRPLDTATRGRSAVGPAVHQEDAAARRERYAELVPRLRAADDAALAAPPAATTRDDVVPEPRGTTEPPAALGLLRDAIDAGDHVVLETIDPTGQPTRRRVKPLVLEGGRLRALDPARDAELTVAVHRIAGVFTDAPAPTQDASTDTTTNASAGAPND